MVIVYLSARGDVYFKCSKCDTMEFIPVELKRAPVWEHYSGIIIMRMIQHYLDAHSSHAQQNQATRLTTQWPVIQ